MENEKRTRRTKEEIVFEIEKKIQYHKECIVALEQKKERTLNPKTRKKSLTMKKILDFAKSEGMSIEDIAEKVGFKLEEN